MPTPTRRLLAVALLWPLAAAASAAEYPGPYTATVTRVVDGDTVHVRVRLWPGLEYAGPLRVAGVDTPELRARHTCERQLAAAARDYVARRLSAAATIQLHQVSLDKYGRALATVRVAGHDLADELIRLGLGRRYQGGRRAAWC